MLARFGRAAVESRHHRNLTVDAQGRQRRRRLARIELARDSDRFHRPLEPGPRKRAQELITNSENLRSNGAGSELRTVGNQIDGNHHVALHLHHRTARLAGKRGAPVALVAEISAVTDERRCPSRQLENSVDRLATPGDECDAPLFQRRRDLLEALQHECKMPLVGLRIVFHQHEYHHHRLSVTIGFADGELERRIVGFALRLLHPVKHVSPTFVRLGVVELPDTLGLYHRRRMPRSSLPINRCLEVTARRCHAIEEPSDSARDIE